MVIQRPFAGPSAGRPTPKLRHRRAVTLAVGASAVVHLVVGLYNPDALKAAPLRPPPASPLVGGGGRAG
jgi:hypothetical protein